MLWKGSTDLGIGLQCLLPLPLQAKLLHPVMLEPTDGKECRPQHQAGGESQSATQG